MVHTKLFCFLGCSVKLGIFGVKTMCFGKVGFTVAGFGGLISFSSVILIFLFHSLKSGLVFNRLGYL